MNCDAVSANSPDNRDPFTHRPRSSRGTENASTARVRKGQYLTPQGNNIDTESQCQYRDLAFRDFCFSYRSADARHAQNAEGRKSSNELSRLIENSRTCPNSVRFQLKRTRGRVIAILRWIVIAALQWSSELLVVATILLFLKDAYETAFHTPASLCQIRNTARL